MWSFAGVPVHVLLLLVIVGTGQCRIGDPIIFLHFHMVGGTALCDVAERLQIPMYPAQLHPHKHHGKPKCQLKGDGLIEEDKLPAIWRKLGWKYGDKTVNKARKMFLLPDAAGLDCAKRLHSTDGGSRSGFMSVERYFDNVIFPNLTQPGKRAALCPGFRYATVMHDPIKRIARHLHHAWRAAHLGEAKHWLRQFAMQPGSIIYGTPSISNFYIRSLLGAEVFYSQTHQVRRQHLEQAKTVLEQMDLVLTEQCLYTPGAKAALRERLGWNDATPERGPTPDMNAYADVADHKHSTAAKWIQETFGMEWWNLLLQANQLDIELYRKAQDLAGPYCQQRYVRDGTARPQGLFDLPSSHHNYGVRLPSTASAYTASLLEGSSKYVVTNAKLRGADKGARLGDVVQLLRYGEDNTAASDEVLESLIQDIEACGHDTEEDCASSPSPGLHE